MRAKKIGALCQFSPFCSLWLLLSSWLSLDKAINERTRLLSGDPTIKISRQSGQIVVRWEERSRRGRKKGIVRDPGTKNVRGPDMACYTFCLGFFLCLGHLGHRNDWSALPETLRKKIMAVTVHAPQPFISKTAKIVFFCFNSFVVGDSRH
jgi:hypothetical protein